MNHLCYIPT